MVNKLNQNWERVTKVFVILIAVFSFTYCTDDPSFVGIEILPKGDILSTGVHEHILNVMNFSKDSIRSDGPNENSYGIIGCYRDRLLGETRADFLTEVSIPLGIDVFNKNIAFSYDSLVLCLAYSKNGWYGDTLQQLNFKIYELNTRLSFAEKYYNNESVEGKYNPIPIAEKLASPKNNIPDSIWNTSNYENVLRFNISDSILIRKIFNFTNDNLAHRDSFKNVLNGFYITCDLPPIDRTGALFNINLLSNNSVLKFFYKKKVEDYITGEVYGFEKDSCSFPINRESRMFNRFTHTYNEEHDIFNDVNRIYIQGMAGSFAKIDMTDFIQIWRDSIKNRNNYDFSFSGISIEFPVDTFIDEKGLYLERQNYLALYEEDENNNFVFPTFSDESGNTLSVFYSILGTSANPYATYDASSKKFTFRMNLDYFNQLVRDEEMEIKPLYLRSLNSAFNFKRQILTNNLSKPKISVSYVKYK